VPSTATAALIRKRAELAGRIEHARSELDVMLADLAALDTTLRLFDPEIRLAQIKPKPYPPVRGCSTPGMRVRDVLGCLRETGRPMTSAEIAKRLLGARGRDKRMLLRAGEIVGAALRKLRARGVVTAERPGKQVEWRLASE
jgi:hypothetical protein